MIPTDELIFFRGGETSNQNMVGITTVWEIPLTSSTSQFLKGRHCGVPHYLTLKLGMGQN